MAVKSETLRTLTWLAGLLMLCGAMIPTPAGRAGIAGLGALVALVPLIFGAGRLKWVAGLVFLAALGLAIAAWPAATEEMDRYEAHARKR